MTSETNPSGRYRSVQKLAQGGMGVVEIAIREEGAFRRTYAIKRLRDVYVDDEHIRQSFLDEARVAGLLSHPNVVSVIDFGEDERGPYLVMDYIEGMSLARLISWARGQQSPLPVQLCCRIVRQVAEGLHAAHELRDHRGNSLHLVHRDVSPQNVLVSYDSVVRLTDFGIARGMGRLAKTDTGILKGKIAYMSPEQLRFREPDRRSDLFALGVVLHETLAGDRLFAAHDGAETARRVLDEVTPDIRTIRNDVPESLAQLLQRLLAKDREQRPETAREVATSLERIIMELIAEESPIELGQFMRTHFEDERAMRREELEGRFQRAVGPTDHALVTVNYEEGVPTVSLASPKKGVPSPLTTVGLAAGALLALLGLGALAAVALQAPAGVADEGRADAAALGQSSSSTEARSRPDTEEVGGEREGAARAETDEVLDTPTTQVVEEEGLEAEAGPAVRASRPVMRRRMRRRATMSETESETEVGDELWRGFQ